MDFEPVYRKTLTAGEFPGRIEKAKGHLAPCTVCPEVCRVDRTKGELGNCGVGDKALVSSFGPHLGEEAPLRGWRGSGTIFFSGCNLSCQFCQNASISQSSSGQPMNAEELADVMLGLQDRGCHNINFVSPTHIGPQIIEAVYRAAQKGLNLPLVYNTGGYDSQALLKLLAGIIDIYMPDMKYSDPKIGKTYSRVDHYPTVNQQAVKEMHDQVGDLQINEDGLAVRGLLVRHLVLPNGLSGSEKILQFLAEDVSRNTYVNIMDQYRPCYRAHEYPALNRRVTREEYRQVRECAQSLGLSRGDRH